MGFGAFLTSIFVAARTLKLSESEALALGFCCLNAYSTVLSQGRARMLEAETAEGMVKDLLESLKQRKRQEFLDKRTHTTRGRRQLIIDGKTHCRHRDGRALEDRVFCEDVGPTTVRTRVF